MTEESELYSQQNYRFDFHCQTCSGAPPGSFSVGQNWYVLKLRILCGVEFKNAWSSSYPCRPSSQRGVYFKHNYVYLYCYMCQPIICVWFFVSWHKLILLYKSCGRTLCHTSQPRIGKFVYVSTWPLVLFQNATSQTLAWVISAPFREGWLVQRHPGWKADVTGLAANTRVKLGTYL
jgi:hypothetical protein